MTQNNTNVVLAVLQSTEGRGDVGKVSHRFVKLLPEEVHVGEEDRRGDLEDDDSLRLTDLKSKR